MTLYCIAKKKLSKKYLFYSIKIQPQKFAQNETALRETAVSEGYLYSDSDEHVQLKNGHCNYLQEI